MADTASRAPATYTQPSRKGKKAWRKNVDISEVQQGLDEVREEIIKTGGVIAEKDSDELFTTDVKGDAEIAKQQAGKKLLKVDELLALRSAVPGLEGRKRKAQAAAPGSRAKKAKNGKYVQHAELQRLREVANRGEVGRLNVEDGDATHDPWGEPEPAKNAQLDFLEPEQKKVEPKTLKHAPKTLAANGRHYPNVRKPDAGKSYNPLAEDYAALLEKEGEAAVAAEQERLAIGAAAADQEARAAAEAAKVEAAEKDDYATDYESAWESEWEGFQSEGEKEVFMQKQRGRKSPAERNKVKARKEREAKEKMEAKDRARKKQEAEIQKIAKEVSARDKGRKAHSMTLVRSQNTSDSDSDASPEPDVRLQKRRFGKVPIPDAPLEVVLPDELEESLRRLKPEGNLMEERYRNLLVSGKLEARKKVWQRKHAKKERTEKWSYKDWKLR